MKNFNPNDIEFFDVQRQPLFTSATEGNFCPIPKKRAIMVDGECVNVVSPSYEVHQPKQIFETFKGVAEKSGLEIRRAILNPKNGGMLLEARYEGTRFVGEDHDVNVCFYTSHDGKYRTFLTLNVLRLACMNQAPALYKGKDRHIFAEKHYRNSLDFERFAVMLEGIPQSVEMFNARTEILNQGVLSYADFQEFMIRHNKWNKDSKQFQTKLDNLKDVYYNAEGQKHLNDNPYKAFNTVTFINTHQGRNSAFQDEQRITTKANDTEKVMAQLVQMAA